MLTFKPFTTLLNITLNKPHYTLRQARYVDVEPYAVNRLCLSMRNLRDYYPPKDYPRVATDACPMYMLSLTAHFIDINFERHNIVLQCQDFTGSHSAEAWVNAFNGMFQSWGIQREKIHA